MKISQSFWLVLVFVSFILPGCKKDQPEDPVFVQLQKDEELIKNYLVENAITAERHPSGIYYVIAEPGIGEGTYRPATRVKVNYTLNLLGGEIIPQATEPVTFSLGNVIMGWRIGIPLIREGGKIRLIVPSGYAYGTEVKPGIPANSILDFEIELLHVTY